MNIKGVLKRLLPFAATFAVAVFITSFFVDLKRPSFRFRGQRGGWHEMNRLRTENDQLKNENLRLRNELENRHFDPMQDLDMAVPPPIAPIAPIAPVAPRAK